MSYKVSVITPVYNAESSLKNAIDSIINQTIGFENIELILVDDKSTDNSRSIVSEYAYRYDNIKSIFLDENTGSPSEPRNIGIENVTAPYFMFLDNDDSYSKNYCEVMYDKISDNDVDMVHAEHISELNNKLYIPNWIESIDTSNFDLVMGDKKFFLGYTSWENIYDTNFIKENEIKFPPTLYEDGVFAIRCLSKTTKPVLHLKDYVGYIYLIENEDSISHKVSLKTLTGFIEGFKLCLSEIQKTNHLDVCEELVSSLINMVLFILAKLDDNLDEGIRQLSEFENSFDFEINLASKPLDIVNKKIMNKQFGQAKILLKLMGILYNNKRIRNYLFVNFSDLKEFSGDSYEL